MNILSNERYGMIMTLLEQGFSQRQVARRTRSHRSAVKRAEQDLAKRTSNLPTGNGPQSVPTCLPGFTRKITPQKKLPSQCEPYRAWIEQQVARGRHAVAIYDDLTEMHGYTGRYNSVRRFVKKLRHHEPERFDVLVFPPGEEAQVDYGQGGRCHTERQTEAAVPVRDDAQILRHGLPQGGLENEPGDMGKTARRGLSPLSAACPNYVVLDNLKEGVIKPDIYEPELNKRLRRDAGALRRCRRSLPRRRPEPKGHGRAGHPAYAGLA